MFTASKITGVFLGAVALCGIGAATATAATPTAAATNVAAPTGAVPPGDVPGAYTRSLDDMARLEQLMFNRVVNLDLLAAELAGDKSIASTIEQLGR